MNVRRLLGLAIACVALFTGCASDGGSGSSGSVSSHSAFYYGNPWYNYPYYYYDDPDYVVVPPDTIERPGDRPRPEHPIAGVPPEGGARPGQLPAERPVQGTRPETRPSTSSRMPSAQPRTTRSYSRPSIPSRSRGGGMSRGGGRRR
ncbi:MAG: hypothetical protein QY320_03230 [Gammaproteobacteria bacterium]|nr:MAG: hypothetical protein QY320_03230 [Gammaproteobacteria bacterium]